MSLLPGYPSLLTAMHSPSLPQTNTSPVCSLCSLGGLGRGGRYWWQEGAQVWRLCPSWGPREIWLSLDLKLLAGTWIFPYSGKDKTQHLLSTYHRPSPVHYCLMVMLQTALCFSQYLPMSCIEYIYIYTYIWKQMWELDCEEGWAPKNWCFWTVVLRRLLRVPWTARRSNQSFLKEISPGCSLEGLMLNLKLQYFGHLMRRADSFEKTLMLGKIEGRRGRGWQRMRLLDDITDTMDMGLGGLQELVTDREAWRAAVHEVAKNQTRLSNWTELNWKAFDVFNEVIQLGQWTLKQTSLVLCNEY